MEADKHCGVADTLTVKRDAFFVLVPHMDELVQDFNKRLEARASELIGMARAVALDIKTYLLLKAAEKSPATQCQASWPLQGSSLSGSATRSSASRSKTPRNSRKRLELAPNHQRSDRIGHTTEV